jgi:hypothetical protein
LAWHVLSQTVTLAEASSPAAFCLLPAQAWHVFEPSTYSFAWHSVAVQAVSPAVSSSPAALVLPAAQFAQLPEATCWFTLQVAAFTLVNVAKMIMIFENMIFLLCRHL